jgi:hypothetical protein
MSNTHTANGTAQARADALDLPPGGGLAYGARSRAEGESRSDGPTEGGVSDLRALGTSACARRSMGPERAALPFRSVQRQSTDSILPHLTEAFIPKKVGATGHR